MSPQRYTADSITDDALDQLYANASRGWRRGDEWKSRAQKAERALERVEALAYRWETALAADTPYARSLRAALAGPKEQSTP
ncbi:hypothetical protein ABZ281_36595 [Streptomyces sp. NPDC006265]|uniref:hypothetical protein n=1 Tax=Streptomyces sp. NPDC006265 TaxID=3156740 RepID=UPI0033A58F27